MRGVVSGLLQLATQGRPLAEKTFLLKSVASKRPDTASGCGGAGPSAASPLLPDAPRHRLRRGSLHPTPRRSQRRLTPFFHGLLALIVFSTSITAADLKVVLREWDVPTPDSRPHDPEVAPDGALWYTGQLANKLGRLDPKTGAIKEFPVKTPESGPHG